MAALEPPTRSFLTAEGSVPADSASTSITQFEMTEAGNGGRILDSRLIESTSHELLRDNLSSPEPNRPASGAEEKGRDHDAREASQSEAQVPQTPQVYLTFLIISGRRRTMSFEPETTIGRVKELVWNTWPAEWEDERPIAPSHIRVLYLGKMLQDEDTLTRLKIPSYTPDSTSAPTSTIVHLSVRPFIPQSETDLKKNKRNRHRSGDGVAQPGSINQSDDSSTGCCCIIC